jgi:hypothetical protein
VLERLTSILCVSFARCLRIFEAVASTENYQTFLPPKFNVVAEPAIRARLKVEVFVDEIVATMALPEQSAFDRCPYYCHINHIYRIYRNARKCGPLVGSHARFLEAPESYSSSSRQALTHRGPCNLSCDCQTRCPFAYRRKSGWLQQLGSVRRSLYRLTPPDPVKQCSTIAVQNDPEIRTYCGH